MGKSCSSPFGSFFIISQQLWEWDLADWGWDLAGFDPPILRHSGIWGAADVPLKNKKIPLLVLGSNLELNQGLLRFENFGSGSRINWSWFTTWVDILLVQGREWRLPPGEDSGQCRPEGNRFESQIFSCYFLKYALSGFHIDLCFYHVLDHLWLCFVGYLLLLTLLLNLYNDGYIFLPCFKLLMFNILICLIWSNL